MGFSKWAVLDAKYQDPESGETLRVFEPHDAQLEMMKTQRVSK